MNEQVPGKHDQVLFSLVVNLQMMAMAQLGKIQDPATGEMSRNLEQAASTIDILEMLKTKCRTDTPAELLEVLDKVVMELQLNYTDEARKGADDTDQPAAEEAAADDNTDAPADEDGGAS